MVTDQVGQEITPRDKEAVLDVDGRMLLIEEDFIHGKK
jgi:hypothetical protein